MLTPIYKLIWLILHLLLTTYDTLQNVFSQLLAMLIWSYDRCCSGVNAKIILQKEKQFLEECKSDLTKIPRHLSIIIGPDNKHVNELLLKRIFTYANIMDVDCISVFDTRLPEKGYIALEQLQVPKNFKFQTIQDNYFQWCALDENSKSNGYVNSSSHSGCAAKDNKNGFLQNGDCSMLKKMEVFQITNDDGRPMLANVCRDLFKERTTQLVKELLQKERNYLTQYITDALHSHIHTKVDPELCIIFNWHTCTFGMLPWQTRFTEFYTHNTAYNFNVYSFAKILYSYSHCEQRWGQ